MRSFSVMDHGAVGDGVAHDTLAIQKAIDRCAEAGGGAVVLPSGKTFLAGGLALRSNIEFRVERGARLVASADREAYHAAGLLGNPDPTRAWIVASGAENLRITGGGVVDGRSRLFVTEELPHILKGTLWRPMMMALSNCRRVVVDGIVLRDAANWAVNLECCEDAVVSRVSLICDLKHPNNDGIHPHHSRNVRISDCYVECGDDAIVVSSSARHAASFGPCENIHVSNCTLISTSSAFKSPDQGIGEHTPWGQVIRGPNPGVFVYAAADVALRDCDVLWEGNPRPWFGSALEAHGAERLAIDRFRGRAANPERDPDIVRD
jgi:polygalacturonase